MVWQQHYYYYFPKEVLYYLLRLFAGGELARGSCPFCRLRRLCVGIGGRGLERVVRLKGGRLCLLIR